MSPESDYSIHPTTGTREIPDFRRVDNRDEQRQRGTDRRGQRRRRGSPVDQEDVQVELTEAQPPEDVGSEPTAVEDDADLPEAHEVDYLA